MNEAFLYGIGALLICFTAGNLFLKQNSNGRLSRRLRIQA